MAAIDNRAALPLSVPRLESPTRSLLMEAPKGIQILAEAGDIQAICRNELRLESKDGEVCETTAQMNMLLILVSGPTWVLMILSLYSPSQLLRSGNTKMTEKLESMMNQVMNVEEKTKINILTKPCFKFELLSP